MTGIEAIQRLCGAAIGAEDAACLSAAAAAPSESFNTVLSRGLAEVERRVDVANDAVRSFAVDDSVPIHEVTIALEQARLAVDLAMQIRARLVEAYRDIMNMQL